jgi:hypothetical protein
MIGNVFCSSCKVICYSCQVLMKLGFISTDFFLKCRNIRFHENRCCGEPRCSMRRDRRTEGRTVPQRDGQTRRGTDRRTEVRTDAQRDGQTHRGSDRRAEGRTDAQGDGQTHRGTDRRTGGRTNMTKLPVFFFLIFVNVPKKFISMRYELKFYGNTSLF